MNNIELELRAEVSTKKFNDLLVKLKENHSLVSHTKRLSSMFLGKINKSNFDIRVRINSNSAAEIVMKKGDFHTHDRIEVAQAIQKDQFMGIVRMFSSFGFKSKITERENFTFNLGNNISLVLVRAGKISYVEIEKMSNTKNLEKNKEDLLRIISDLKLKLIKDSKEFNELCKRLTIQSDWAFDGSEKHLRKLKKLILSY